MDKCQDMHDSLTGGKNILNKYLTRLQGVMDVVTPGH